MIKKKKKNVSQDHQLFGENSHIKYRSQKKKVEKEMGREERTQGSIKNKNQGEKTQQCSSRDKGECYIQEQKQHSIKKRAFVKRQTNKP